MGVISNLSDEQERLKGIMLDDREMDTFAKTMQSILVSQPIDEVVNCAIVHAEMSRKISTESEDILWAAEFLDHLDTIGWKITPKNRRQRRGIPHVQEMPGVSSGD